MFEKSAHVPFSIMTCTLYTSQYTGVDQNQNTTFKHSLATQGNNIDLNGFRRN